MHSTEPWPQGLLASLDTETTGVDVRRSRMVSFALLYIDGTGRVLPRSLSRLVDPGVEIEPGATAVHGLAAADLVNALPHDTAINQLMRRLATVARLGIPLVVFNAPFDLTLLAVQAGRLNLPWPQGLLVIDPLAIDRMINRHRPGRRTLGDLCLRAGVKLMDAHDPSADALASAQLARAQAERYPIIAETSLDRLQTLQCYAHLGQVQRMQLWAKRTGKKIDTTPGWPVRDGAL